MLPISKRSFSTGSNHLLSSKETHKDTQTIKTVLYRMQNAMICKANLINAHFILLPRAYVRVETNELDFILEKIGSRSQKM